MPELRVFISSTFRDLQNEREHLVKKVFPEIRSLCRERGVTFTEVDLRWGISEEEAEEDGIVRICLDEIDRCRPYFIGILGERYGWVPSKGDAGNVEDGFPDAAASIGSGASITEMEIVHGVLANSRMSRHAFFYFRDRATTPVSFVDTDPRTISRLNNLKDRIRQSGFPLHENFRSPSELGRLVEDDLRALIDDQFPASGVPSPLDQERCAHAAFAASRRHAYVTGADFQGRFQIHTRYVITGKSGLGKSSLVAFLADDFRNRHPASFVVEYYVGASQMSGSAMSLMRFIIEEIRARFAIDDEIPSEPEELEKSFSTWLFRAEYRAKQQGIGALIVIDAVNQLDDVGRRLAWLPATIPTGIRFVVSTTPGECLDQLARRQWPVFEVAPIKNALMRRKIIERYLSEFRKGITRAQMHLLTSDTKASSPLFLRVVAEELRLHGVRETLDEVIVRYSESADLHQVFDRVLERLELDYTRSAVQDTLRVVAASRSGLSETEILALTRLRRIELSQMLFALDYHLLNRDGLYAFFHEYLRGAVQKRYFPDDESWRDAHLQLAEYFQSGVAASIAEGREVPTRLAGELVYQINAAADVDRLRDCLSTIPVFLSLYAGPGQFEILAYWSSVEDPDEIETRYRMGLEKWSAEDDQERCIAVGMIANLLQRLGCWNGADAFERMRLATAIASGNRSQEAASHMGLGTLMQLRGDNAAAYHEFELAHDIYVDLGDQGGASGAIGGMGVTHYRRGQYDRAMECYQQQLEVAEKLGDRSGIARVVGNVGAVHFNRGEYQNALECFQRQLSMGEMLGDRERISAAIGNMGGVYFNLGSYDRALECYDRKMNIDAELGDRRGVATALGNMGLLYSERRDDKRALECQQRQLRIYEQLGDRHGCAIAIGNIGMIYADHGDYDAALQHYQQQLDICDEIDDRTGVAIALGNMGPVHVNRGEHDRALECYRKQMRLSEELGDRRSFATALGNIGIAFADRNEYEQALANLSRSADEHRAADLLYGLAYCLEGIGRVLLELVIAFGSSDSPSSMPACLSDCLPDVTPETWRSRCVQRAQECAEECISISEKLALPDTRFSGKILLARVVAAGGRPDVAMKCLNELVAETLAIEDPGVQLEDQARLTYWLWRVGADELHRRESLRLHQLLVEASPKFENRKRLEDLQELT